MLLGWRMVSCWGELCAVSTSHPRAGSGPQQATRTETYCFKIFFVTQQLGHSLWYRFTSAELQRYLARYLWGLCADGTDLHTLCLGVWPAWSALWTNSVARNVQEGRQKHAAEDGVGRVESWQGLEQLWGHCTKAWDLHWTESCILHPSLETSSIPWNNSDSIFLPCYNLAEKHKAFSNCFWYIWAQTQSWFISWFSHKSGPFSLLIYFQPLAS